MTDVQAYHVIEKVLALSHFAGVGPRLFDSLLTRFGTLDAILQASPDEIKHIDGITNEQAATIAKATTHLTEAASLHKKLSEREINIVTRFETTYPSLVFELNDPPPLLYVRGSLPANNKKSVTLIGTRKATNEGIELTVKLAQAFAKAEVQVISSLYSGIDAAAHLGCKAADSRSFAILDTGFDYIETTEQMPLAIDIVQTGGIISEYAPSQAYTSSHRSSTNRLLVGFSNAVVVTELYQNSERILDLLSFCRDIGKLAFLMVEPKHGALSETKTLDIISDYGVIPIVGLEHVNDIINALV